MGKGLEVMAGSEADAVWGKGWKLTAVQGLAHTAVLCNIPLLDPSYSAWPIRPGLAAGIAVPCSVRC